MGNLVIEKVLLIGDMNVRIAEKRGTELWNNEKEKRKSENKILNGEIYKRKQRPSNHRLWKRKHQCVEQ